MIIISIHYPGTVPPSLVPCGYLTGPLSPVPVLLEVPRACHTISNLPLHCPHLPFICPLLSMCSSQSSGHGNSVASFTWPLVVYVKVPKLCWTASCTGSHFHEILDLQGGSTSKKKNAFFSKKGKGASAFDLPLLGPFFPFSLQPCPWPLEDRASP